MAAKLTAPKRIEKISDRIIAQIRDMILSGQLNPGDKVGSEKELIAQFEVSKATLREALRVLEALGLVEIRKGLSGGVFIAKVDMKTTIHSIMNFLRFEAVSIRDITMIRYFLEPSIAEMVASTLTKDDIARLKATIEMEAGEPYSELSRGISFHRYLARLTHNPILILIMDFIDNLLTDMKSKSTLGADFYGRVKKSHTQILDCLIRRDGAAARRVIIADILSVGYSMAQVLGTAHFDPVNLRDDSFLPFQEIGKRTKEKIEADLESGSAFPPLSDKSAVSPQQPQEMLFERVGSGDLYLLVLRDRKKDEKEE
jgi:GntR family transcriptional repressor for pyruvate dehydrogenase complex